MSNHHHIRKMSNKKKWKSNKSLPLTWSSNLASNSFNKSNSTSNVDVILTRSQIVNLWIRRPFFVDEYHLVHIVHLETIFMECNKNGIRRKNALCLNGRLRCQKYAMLIWQWFKMCFCAAKIRCVCNFLHQ